MKIPRSNIYLESGFLFFHKRLVPSLVERTLQPILRHRIDATSHTFFSSISLATNHCSPKPLAYSWSFGSFFSPLRAKHAHIRTIASPRARKRARDSALWKVESLLGIIWTRSRKRRSYLAGVNAPLKDSSRILVRLVLFTRDPSVLMQCVASRRRRCRLQELTKE